ncbi:MAG: M23 family metallopeptidase [Candidatus Daviesbacteria bacterium]|nr:M23 family metallopeptidase [Candidatus Daviesbacteria bacterium]
MKNKNENLLSRIVSQGDALTAKLSKIKLRFLKRFTKLVIITFISLTLLGYYPTFSIPPVRRSIVKAVPSEQKGEIIAQNFSKPLILPHPGYLSTRFSSWHPGIDIATGLGMPIHPIIDGEVSETGRDFFGLGNFVVVTHQNGFKSKYAHMGKIFVKVGDKITEENILGEVGLTGHTSGPHTHLEITHDGNYVDPQALLPEIPDMPVVLVKK